MNWDDIRYFLALVRGGTLSEAGNILMVKHSTVSRRMSKFEKHFKINLFHRMPKGWILTDDGNVLLNRAKNIESEIYEFQRAIDDNFNMTGAVKISATSLLATNFIIPYLERFNRNFPLVSIDISCDNKNANLINGDVDIALRLGEISELNLIARPLGSLKYALYGHEKYMSVPEKERKYIGFCGNYPNTPQKNWLNEYLKEKECLIKTNDLSVMFNAISSGLGVGILPKFMVKDKCDLIEISLEDNPPPKPVYLVMHTDVRRSPRIRVVADYIIEIFERYRNSGW
ncbi:LysR family transcriptional regulator [Yersinia aldovae]|nr:LysR family transcriptional regulator [Yersinia aldovae]